MLFIRPYLQGLILVTALLTPFNSSIAYTFTSAKWLSMEEVQPQKYGNPLQARYSPKKIYPTSLSINKYLSSAPDFQTYQERAKHHQ